MKWLRALERALVSQSEPGPAQFARRFEWAWIQKPEALTSGPAGRRLVLFGSRPCCLRFSGPDELSPLR